ncbi:hypothetical protein NC653_004628 [Populus alba x Populus x berolinensis]|uniref:Uncharacterized protein n=1 Tax=Populus alba x Populus x berolinensis TaxID=444605 RepID=A0AAD6WNG9_9ROSI|nr:hypothetical protein NC653_004628 [Populus alba x Populus x berolinensis]
MQGEAIQGSTKARDIPLFSNFIVDGKHYKIKGFYTYENISVNMVLENDAIIDLKLDTIFLDVLKRIKTIQPLQQILACGQNLENKKEIILVHGGSKLIGFVEVFLI